MKAKELISLLSELDPDTEIKVSATPAQTLSARLDGSTIVPAFAREFDPRRGSLCLRRSRGESFLISLDGKVVAEVTNVGQQTVRVTAPRSVKIMRNEIASAFIED